ncbi:MAG: transporter [Burkholderiales bacterium]|nr:transporter [Burkholderiales bacterium]MDE2432917.1 transporter [Burkholderiales bacterium]
MQRMSPAISLRQAVVKTSVFAITMVACAASMASENGLQRYSPGVGGSDMTAPVVPGWYWQTAVVSYKATQSNGNDGKPVSNPAFSSLSADVSTTAALNRLTYVGTQRVLGANLGFTIMQPIGQRKGTFTAVPKVTGIPAYDYAFAAGAAMVNGQSGKTTGMGDLEFGPLFHWEIGDHQAANFVPTIVLPTGDYDVTRRLNMGYGNFYTFRPSTQYAYIGDGWDVGGRAVLSFNTRNKANGYYSGNMFNLDWQAMKFVTEDVRVGLQGYMVRQLSRDTCKAGAGDTLDCSQSASTMAAVATGNKTSVDAVGPAVAWLKNGGDFLLEGKFMKEFNAKNRTEGKAFWLTLSKPL